MRIFQKGGGKHEAQRLNFIVVDSAGKIYDKDPISYESQQIFLPNKKTAGLNRQFFIVYHVFFINLLPHFGQVISILPFPLGTRIF